MTSKNGSCDNAGRRLIGLAENDADDLRTLCAY